MEPPDLESRVSSIEARAASMESKLDDIMEMVYLGKHLMIFAKVLAWIGGAYITLETYLKTFYHK